MDTFVFNTKKRILAGIGAVVMTGTACLPQSAYIDYNGDGQIDADEKLWRETVLLNQVRDAHSPTDCYGEMRKHWPVNLHGWAEGIIRRESGGNAAAQNPNSSAAGCFQLIHSLHADKYPADCRDRYNAHCNVQAAWNLYQEDPTAWRFSG